MRGRFAAVVGTLCWLCAAALWAQPSTSRLTPTDIDEAISLGMTGRPEPYPLRSAPGLTPDEKLTSIVGVVYTPFLRVALVARAARDAGQLFAAADVPASLTEPLIYIAFRWSPPEPSPASELLSSVEPQVVAMPRTKPRLPMPHGGIPPTWMRRDTSILRQFGEPPFGDLAAVVAYPLEFLMPDHEFVIYRSATTPDGGEVAELIRGCIVAQELQHWR